MHVQTLFEGLGTVIAPTPTPVPLPPASPPPSTQNPRLPSRGFSGPGVYTRYGVPVSATRVSIPRTPVAARPASSWGQPSPSRVTTARTSTARRIVSDPNFRATLPSFDELRRFQYSREQIQEMIERGQATRAELETKQKREGGDGISLELEQQAAETNATEKAVSDGAGISKPKKATTGAGQKNIAPLAVAALLAYFLI